jgi:gluconokinase
MEVGFPTSAEGSAFGAALLGLQALGAIDSTELAADLIPLAEVRRPEPAAAARYRELLPIFAALYEELTPAFQALAEGDGERHQGLDSGNVAPS